MCRTASCCPGASTSELKRSRNSCSVVTSDAGVASAVHVRSSSSASTGASVWLRSKSAAPSASVSTPPTVTLWGPSQRPPAYVTCTSPARALGGPGTTSRWCLPPTVRSRNGPLTASFRQRSSCALRYCWAMTWACGAGCRCSTRRRGLREPRGARRTAARPAGRSRRLEELGPTFAKLGQILSTRPDLLPRAFVDELAARRLRPARGAARPCRALHGLGCWSWRRARACRCPKRRPAKRARRPAGNCSRPSTSRCSRRASSTPIRIRATSCGSPTRSTCSTWGWSARSLPTCASPSC